MRLRVVSWNIHKGIGGVDRRYRLERIRDVLAALNPDLALLQEVADGWPRAGGNFQAHWLAEQLDMSDFAFYPEHRFARGGYGNAVLSRFPIVDQARIDLKIAWRKQRSALQVRVKLPNECMSDELFATSLHLGLAEGERRLQLARLFEIELHHAPSAPSLLGGDFNDVFGSVETRFFQSRGYLRLGERQRTFPAAFPCLGLDGIFGFRVQPLEHVRCISPYVSTASDHLPIIADFDVE